MIVLPAIDLIGGRCVRLEQGDFKRETAYSRQPADALSAFAEHGAREVHLVDLDGALASEPRQHDLFAELAGTTSLDLQVAGGVRKPDHVARLLDAGVKRVVVGSLAVQDPAAMRGLLDRFGPDRLTLALDVSFEDSEPVVVTHGWTRSSGRPLAEVLSEFGTVEHLLVTDIARDGMLSGPNVALVRKLIDDFPGVAVQASGGVASLADLDALRRWDTPRVIVGKALWEGRFTLEEALDHARA